MAFNDPASAIVISRIGSDWALIDEQMETSEEGWDILTQTLIRDFGNLVLPPENVAAQYPVGRRDPLRSFWVISAKPKRRAANVWQLEVSYKGTANPGAAPKVRIEATSASVTGPGRLFNITGQTWQNVTVNILKSSPVMTAQYILIDAVPPTQRVGMGGGGFNVPPRLVNPPEPQRYWDQLDMPGYVLGTFGTSDFTINLPHGWYMSGLSCDVLKNTDVDVSLVTETWEWRQKFVAN